MKHSILVKTIAIILATCALAAAVGGGVGMFAMGQAGLYDQTVAELQAEQMTHITYQVADSLVREYIRSNLANANENWMEYSGFFGQGYDYWWYEFNDQLGTDGWRYSISNAEDTQVLESGGGGAPYGAEISTDSLRKEYIHTVSMTYPQLVACMESPEQDDADYGDEHEIYATTAPAPSVLPGTGVTEPIEYDEICRWYNEETGSYYDYYFKWVESDTYIVRLSLPQGFVANKSFSYWQALTLLQQHQHLLPVLLWVGLVVFAAAMVYLVLSAGRKPGSEDIRPAALNRIPLDFYTVAGVCGVVAFGALCVTLLEWAIYQRSDGIHWGIFSLALAPVLAAAALVVGWLFALAAQFQAKGGFWWRNSLTGRFLLWMKRNWQRLLRYGKRIFSLMPCFWQWAAAAAILGAALLLTGIFMLNQPSFFWFMVFLMELAACGLVVAYGAYAFGTILEGAGRMAKGDLNTKIKITYLFGCFEDCARQLNTLADVAVVAAKNQLKSDRMKTELITNVSHDIKTPLTSIINYVDLLQKAQTPQEREEYLTVLARQSQQMKKLIEDLMEMSKATTGNMTVEIGSMDAAEAVNQALGEFSDKLAAVPLTPVFRQPEAPVMIRADGRLVWRTLSNLLQNAVKYALPGTRLYVDIARLEGSVVISLKNISREELNISADELMERFVRGDASRNTEGSGLGLNIAKSLMELQRGQLRLLVDGDLFKASLIFPAGE